MWYQGSNFLLAVQWQGVVRNRAKIQVPPLPGSVALSKSLKQLASVPHLSNKHHTYEEGLGFILAKCLTQSLVGGQEHFSDHEEPDTHYVALGLSHMKDLG